MTHRELIEIGYKWLMKRCSFAFKELVSAGGYGECPDVIGFNSLGSFLLEAKISRSDFLKDKKKIFRIEPEKGMGDWRFFICPKGLIKKDELPNMWGLIEVNEKGKALTTYNPFGKGNIYSLWKRNKKFELAEISMMKSALRRIEEKKLMDNIYPSKTKCPACGSDDMHSFVLTHYKCRKCNKRWTN